MLLKKAYYCHCVIVSTPSEGNAVMKALQEANMSTEVGLVVLDILALYTQTFKVSYLSSLIQSQDSSQHSRCGSENSV